MAASGRAALEALVRITDANTDELIQSEHLEVLVGHRLERR